MYELLWANLTFMFILLTCITLNIAEFWLTYWLNVSLQ